MGRRCMDGNPDFKHSLALGERMGKGLAHVEGNPASVLLGQSWGAKLGVGWAEHVCEEIKCEAG